MIETQELVLTPIDKVGACREGTIGISYSDLIEIIGFEENVSDDPDKVEASWGFKDQNGREGFVWCYKQSKLYCGGWSCYGDKDLLKDLFGNRYRSDKSY